jgi:hypothetical protein
MFSELFRLQIFLALMISSVYQSEQSRIREFDDRETGKAARKGVLAMQIIPGEPMKVQYKDIRLKERK